MSSRTGDIAARPLNQGRMRLKAGKLGAAALLGLCALSISAPAGVRAEIVRREGALVTVIERGQSLQEQGTREDAKEKAKREAIRKAIELAAGVIITASSTLQNFELEKDVIEAYTRVYIRSVREIAWRFDESRRAGSYEGEFVIDTSAMEALAKAPMLPPGAADGRVEARVFLFDDKGTLIPDGAEVREGQRFHVMIEPLSELHAYIFSRDSRGALTPIFPNSDYSPAANPLRARQQYHFPALDSTRIFAFDEHPGQELFYFLLSAAPLSDIEALLAELRGPSSGASPKLIAPILQERIASRGFRVESRPTTASLPRPDGAAQLEQRMGEILRGQGAFVKTVTLRHVR